MRKTAYLILFCFLTSAIVEAQFCAGGSLNFSTSGGNTEYDGTKTDKNKTTSVSFSPKVGYFYSEKILFGAQIVIGSSRTKSPGDPEQITSTISLGFVPFARYYAVKFNKFSLFAQGQAGLTLGSTSTKVDGETTDGPVTTEISISAFPGIAYDLNEKIQLEAYIGGFNFGFSHLVRREPVGDDYSYDRTNNFGFGVNTNNIVTTGNITIGAIYRF